MPLGPANLFKAKSKATETKEEKINDLGHTPHYGI